jgi:recombination protein RecA
MNTGSLGAGDLVHPPDQTALSSALARIERQFGKGAVVRLRQEPDVEVISTGSLSLNLALGIGGGLPRGRVVEIYGPESSGKTTLALHVIAEAQKSGGTAAFIDAEHALDLRYASKLGVDVPELLVSQPDSGEQALEIVDTLVRSAAVDVVVVDSVAALAPRAELDGEMGEPQRGLQARLMSQALRKLTSSINRTNTLAIFTNQLRTRSDLVGGDTETTTGGSALGFYASVRLDIRRLGSVEQGGQVVAAETRVRVVKNKVAAPFGVADFLICHGRGISRSMELIALGQSCGCIEKVAAGLSFCDIQLGQGAWQAAEFLGVRPDLAVSLEARIQSRFSGKPLLIAA